MIMTLFKAKKVYHNAEFSSLPLAVENGVVVSRDIDNGDVVDFNGCYIDFYIAFRHDKISVNSFVTISRISFLPLGSPI